MQSYQTVGHCLMHLAESAAVFSPVASRSCLSGAGGVFLSWQQALDLVQAAGLVDRLVTMTCDGVVPLYICIAGVDGRFHLLFFISW